MSSLEWVQRAGLGIRSPSVARAARVRSVAQMRRLAPHAVDELDRLFKILLEFRSNGKERLPVYAELVLCFLAQQQDGAARFRALREQIGLPQARTTRVCAAMAEAGFLHVFPSPEDRRTSTVKLTAKGFQLIDRVLSASRSRSR